MGYIFALTTYRVSFRQRGGGVTFSVDLRGTNGQHVNTFLQRDAMHKRGLRYHAVSVCLSVCPSRS